MNLKRLRAFVTVVERGTVSKAAHALRLTQPAVSRQINDLERDLGFKLFERSGRRLQLTARADQVLGDCRGLLAHARVLAERAQTLRQDQIYLLKVAAPAWMIERAFPTFLQQYSQSAPKVRVTPIEAPAADHPGMLESDEVHLAATIIHTAEAYDDRFACCWLPNFAVVAAGSRLPEVAEANAIDIGHLAKHPLLLLKSPFATRRIFDAACRLAGVTPNVIFESGTPHTLLALARAGHGMAIVPSIHLTDRGGLRFLRVTHRQAPLRIATAVVWSKRHTPTDYAEKFAQLLTAHILKAFPHTRPKPRCTSDASPW